MSTSPAIRRSQIIAIVLLVLLWLCITGLLIVSGGNAQRFLETKLGRYSYADAYHDLNGPLVMFWAAHSLLVVSTIEANWYQRADVFTVLLIGPALVVVIAAVQQQWDDPVWVVIVGILLVGWIASLVTAAGYWIVKNLLARHGHSC